MLKSLKLSQKFTENITKISLAAKESFPFGAWSVKSVLNVFYTRESA